MAHEFEQKPVRFKLPEVVGFHIPEGVHIVVGENGGFTISSPGQIFTVKDPIFGSRSYYGRTDEIPKIQKNPTIIEGEDKETSEPAVPRMEQPN